LSHSATLTGIATNGTDIWLVDSYQNKVYKYNGAASLRSGSQSASSSFRLSISDSNPQDIVSDGTSFWVVDGTALKVFKYTLSGSLLGSWAIDPADAHPTGITINPTNVSDIWIVDNGTLKVYQYTAAAGRTSGSQNASATFALNPYDTNPQGIADPPVPDTLLSAGDGLSAATAPLTPDRPTGTALSATDEAFVLLLAPGNAAPSVTDCDSPEQPERWLRAQDVLAIPPGGTDPRGTPTPALPHSSSLRTPDRLFADLLSSGLADALAAETLLTPHA
jgi:hypothetical protein